MKHAYLAMLKYPHVRVLVVLSMFHQLPESFLLSETGGLIGVMTQIVSSSFSPLYMREKNICQVWPLANKKQRKMHDDDDYKFFLHLFPNTIDGILTCNVHEG